MSEEWMKAAVWGLVTLAMLIVLWSSWRSYRADQTRLKKLQDFRDSYTVEMAQLYRWFASDECALMVLDWLDRELVGGERRPDDSYRLDVASHGLQAVRQAVRDSHFNDSCRGAADASCAMSVAASNQPRITPEQMADLRNAYREGVDLDVFMALCLNQLLEGRTVKVISERREYLNPRPELAPFDRISEPVVRRIVNDLGEQVWPCAEDAFTVEAAAPKDGEPCPHHVQVIYEVVEPTVDEKVDEVLRLMRVFENAWDKSPKSIGREEQQAMRAAPVSQAERETIRAVFLRNGFTIKEGQTDLKPYVYAAAEELLSTARATWQHTQSAGVPDGERLAELLESVRLGDDEAKPHGSGATYWNNAVFACQVAIRDALAAAPAQPAAQEQHPDDEAVDRFAVAMKAKLAKSREKGRHGWQTASAAHLSGLLYRHMYKADPLDVANLAMMLHQNGQAIELPQEARHDQGEVQRLREALEGVVKRCSKEHGGSGYVGRDGQYLKVIDAALAVSKPERLPLESLEFVKRPVPSGWAVKRPAIDARYVDNYLGPLEGWLEDPRRAVLFGNQEAAIAAQAALSVESKLPISVVWLVYDPVFDTYREQAQ